MSARTWLLPLLRSLGPIPWRRSTAVAAAAGLAAATTGAGYTSSAAAACAVIFTQMAFGRRATDAATGRRTAAALNKAVFDSVVDGIVGFDCAGRVTFINPAAETLSGWNEDEVIGKTCADTFCVSEWLTSAPEAALFRVETSLPRRTGDSIPVEMHLSPIVERGQVTGRVAVFHDIRERRSAEENRRLAAAVLEWSAQAIIVADHKGSIITVNPAFSRLSGHAPDEIIGQPVSALRSDRHDAAFHTGIRTALDRDGAWKGEVWNRRKDGTPYAVWLSITRISAGIEGAGFLVAFYFDITERKRHEERIIEAANHDALTGLPNRRMFEGSLALTTEQAACQGRAVAVLMIDLDGFKAVNDTHGHDAGDILLKTLAHRMTATIRSTDMVARLGGDEFVVLLPDMESRAAAARVAETLVDQLSLPVPFADVMLQVSASIGIGILHPGEDPEGLLKAADDAMYAVKRGGKHGYRFHGPDLISPENVVATETLHLAHAFDHGELSILYRPVIDLTTLSVNGIDALVRHRRVDGETFIPDPMRPLSPDTGHDYPIGRWARAEALAALAAWRHEGLDRTTLSLPLSRAEMVSGTVADELRSLLDKHGIPANMIEITVAEDVWRDPLPAIGEALRQLRQLGLGLSVEGFTEMAKVFVRSDDMRPDRLRVPITLLNHGPNGNDDILRKLLKAARSLEARLIVTNVETPDQVNLLLRQDGLLAQGNVLARPIPAAAVSGFTVTFDQTKAWKA